MSTDCDHPWKLFNSISKSRVAKTILLGQLISFLIAGTGFFASLLSNNGVSVPVFLMMFNYAFLIPFMFFRAQSASSDVSEETYSPFQLKCPLWLYIIIAVIDLEANVIIITAYRYTSVTSVMLLDCFSIPCVMLLSYAFLRAQYCRRHLMGTFICLLGMGLIVLSDSQHSNSSDARNPLYGDILCLV